MKLRRSNFRVESLKPAILGILWMVTSLDSANAQQTYVYVGNYYGDSLSGYVADSATGALTSVPGSPFPAGTNPIWVPLDQQCRFVFTPNFASNNISAYTINAANGQATPVAGSPFLDGNGPIYSTLDRLGQFLFVPDYNSNTLFAFSIAPGTAVLSEISGSPFSVGQGPSDATVDPSNRFLYVANYGPSTGSEGSVSGFSIDPTTGNLTPISGSPWDSGGTNAQGVTTDNAGQFLYVTNTVSGNIEVFSINQTTGALSPVGSTQVGFALYKVVIDTTNQFAYATQNAVGIWGFSRNSATGMLTPLPGFPFSNESPQGDPRFAVDPLGGFLFVTNQDTNSIGVWSIGNSGGLTQIAGSPFPAGSSPGSVSACSTPAYTASIQPPIDADGSSVFNANRGSIPVKFTLSQNGTQVCQLPPATIAVVQTSGTNPGPVNESSYSAPSDTGSNFRVDASNCQYVYNLAAAGLGPGSYLIQILINNLVVGSGKFGLN